MRVFHANEFLIVLVSLDPLVTVRILAIFIA